MLYFNNSTSQTTVDKRADHNAEERENLSRNAGNAASLLGMKFRWAMPNPMFLKSFCGQMVRSFDHGQNPNFLWSIHPFGHNCEDNCECQWPRSLCNHYLEISVVKYYYSVLCHKFNIQFNSIQIVKIFTITNVKVQISRGQNGQPEI